MEATRNEFVASQTPLVHRHRVSSTEPEVDSSRAELAIAEHVGIAEAIQQSLGEEAEVRARDHIKNTVSALTISLDSARRTVSRQRRPDRTLSPARARWLLEVARGTHCLAHVDARKQPAAILVVVEDCFQSLLGQGRSRGWAS